MKHHPKVMQKKNQATSSDSKLNSGDSTLKSDSEQRSDSFQTAVGQAQPLPFQKPLLQPEHKVVTDEHIINSTKDNFINNPLFQEGNPNAEKNKEVYINSLVKKGFDKDKLQEASDNIIKNKQVLAEAEKKANANPNDFTATYDAGTSLLGLNKPDDAIAMFNATLGHLGNQVQNTQGIPVQNELAMNTPVNKSAATNPSNSLFGIGSALTQKGDYKGAIDAYNESLKADPNNANSYKGLAYAAYKTGDKVNAEKYLKQAKELSKLDALPNQLGEEAKGDISQQKQADEMKGIADNFERAISYPARLVYDVAKGAGSAIIKGGESVQQGVGDILSSLGSQTGGITDKAKEVGAGALKTGTGLAEIHFNLIPGVAAFNAATKPIQDAAESNPDNKVLQTAADVSTIPFTLYSHILKWTGREPTKGAGEDYANAMNMIIPIVAHSAGVKGINSIKDLADATKKMAAGDLPIDQVKQINLFYDYAKNLKFDDVRVALEKDGSERSKELLADIEKQRQEKVESDKRDFELKKNSQRDTELGAIQPVVKELGQEESIHGDIPQNVVNTIERVHNGIPTDPTALSETKDYLFNENQRLEALKKDNKRMFTIDQINESQRQLEEAYQDIQKHEVEQNDVSPELKQLHEQANELQKSSGLTPESQNDVQRIWADVKNKINVQSVSDANDKIEEAKTETEIHNIDKNIESEQKSLEDNPQLPETVVKVVEVKIESLKEQKKRAKAKIKKEPKEVDYSKGKTSEEIAKANGLAFSNPDEGKQTSQQIKSDFYKKDKNTVFKGEGGNSTSVKDLFGNKYPYFTDNPNYAKAFSFDDEGNQIGSVSKFKTEFKNPYETTHDNYNNDVLKFSNKKEIKDLTSEDFNSFNDKLKSDGYDVVSIKRVEPIIPAESHNGHSASLRNNELTEHIVLDNTKISKIDSYSTSKEAIEGKQKEETKFDKAHDVVNDYRKATKSALDNLFNPKNNNLFGTEFGNKATEQGISADIIKKIADSLFDVADMSIDAAERLKIVLEELKPYLSSFSKEDKESVINAIKDRFNKEGSKNTGLKNLLQRNLPEIKLSKLGNADENLKIGKGLIESGKIDPKEVVQKIIDGNGNVGRTIEEDHAIQYYNRQMESKSNELDLMKSDAEEEIKNNPDSIEAKENAAVIQNEIQQHNDEFTALKISNAIDSNYWGKKGLNKQVEIKPDFTAEEIHREFDNGYGGKVPEKTTKILNEAIEQRDKAKLELKRLEKERDQWKVKSEFESIKERSVKTRSKGRSLKIEDIRKERKSLLYEFKKEWKGNPDEVKQGISITDKMVKLTAQLVDTYVREGFLKLEDVVDKIHEDLKEIIGDDISKKDVRRMIVGEHDETPEPRTKSDAQKQIEEIKKQSKLVNRLEDLQSGKYETKAPKAKAEQSEEIKSLKEQIKKIFKEDYPIEVIKKNLAKQESKLKNIIKSGKFLPEVKQKKIFPKDKQIIEAKQRIANSKHEIAEQRSKMLNSDLSKTQRSLNFIARWNRRRVLSGVTVLGKLSGAALFNYATYIPEELAGEFWGRVFSKIASDSEGEAYINAKASAKYFTEPFKKQRLLDAKSIYKTGTTDLNRLYGNKFSDHYAGYDALLDTHTLIKMFPHTSEFASALEKMTVEFEKQGLDVSEPLMQQALQLKAYKKANYSIFLNDNALVKLFDVFVSGLDEKAVENGDVKLGKFVSDLLLPVKKVPTNIIGRTVTYVTGLPVGITKVAKMYSEGIGTFKPEEKSAVMKQLKKGSLGGALIVSGVIMGAKNTGLYTQNNPDKKRYKQNKSGQLNFLGFDLPHQLQHSPIMMALLTAGTFGMAYNNYYKNIDKETGKIPKHNLVNGLIATAEAAAITGQALLSNMPVLIGATEIGGTLTGNQEAVRRFKKDWTSDFKNKDNNFIPLVKDIKKW